MDGLLNNSVSFGPSLRADSFRILKESLNSFSKRLGWKKTKIKNGKIKEVIILY